MFSFNHPSDQELMNDLAELIKKKFLIKDVKVSGMSIILDNNAFVAGLGKENERPVKLLMAAGAKKETISHEGMEGYSYLTSSKCTLTREQCQKAIKACEQLLDPSQQRVAASNNIVRAC